jgi:tetratricopeptide (TPR) repeat protein
MKKENSKTTVVLLKFVFVMGFFFLSQNIFGSTISGVVYDNQRNPLADVDVELLDDLSRSFNRTRTSESGRYEFSNLRDGRYAVRVMPFRYDLVEDSATVEITTITSVSDQIGNSFFTQDFYLKSKKGGLGTTGTGVVFAQEIPKEAGKAYESAVRELAKKNVDGGILKLREAVKSFPNYYQALQRLGMELFIKQKYGEAVQVFLRASEVNPKSSTCFYYLGNSLNKLNYNKAAIVALNQALIISPSSVQVLYVLGKSEASEGKYVASEKHLLEAEKLSKSGIPEVHWELAQIYANHLKKYKEAADELAQFLKTRPDARDAENIKKLIKTLRDKSKQTG